MKIAFIICNEVYTPRIMDILAAHGVDYYTRWEEVKGKGHGTDPHLGTRSFPGLNAVLMIAFPEHESLEKVVAAIVAANRDIARPDDHIRLFQVPLERIV